MDPELPGCFSFPASGSIDFREASTEWARDGFTSARGSRYRPRRRWTAHYEDVPYSTAALIVNRWEEAGRGVLPMSWPDPDGITRQVEVTDMRMEVSRTSHAVSTVTLELQEVL